MLQKLTEFELYAFMPAPRLQKRTRHGSLAGLLVSIVVIGIGASYAAFCISRLLWNEKATIVVIQNSTAAPSTLMPFQLSLPYINDPSYFTYLVQSRGADAKKVTISRTTLTMTPNGTNIISYGLDGYSATQPQQTIQGDCTVGACTYLRIKITPCLNDSSTVRCQTADTINDVINSNYMVMELFGQKKNGDSQITAVELSLKDALSFRQRFPFNIFTHRDKPNYLTSWKTAAVTTLQLDTPWFAIDRIPRLTSGSNAEYCKLDLQLSGIGFREDRIVVTSLDVIGEIAAFFGAITGVAALVMYTYNENDFYKKNPGWEGFTPDFQKEEPVLHKEEKQSPRAGGGGADDFSNLANGDGSPVSKPKRRKASSSNYSAPPPADDAGAYTPAAHTDV